ncbi:MAG: LamG-like jellyroll fold domain-containing protein, partial [Candidatus Berkelbacteria bacterium]
MTNFFKKLFFKKKKKCGDVMPLSVDEKNKIRSMSEKESAYLDKAEKLDSEILKIQRSTKTLLPQFSLIHNYIRMKWKWYYSWHSSSWAKSVHWSILLVYILALGVFVPMTLVSQPKLVRASAYTWNGAGTTQTCGAGNENNWSCASNWSGGVVPTAADDVIFNATSTKASTVDAGFVNHIKSLSISSGYTNTLTLVNDLYIDNDVTLAAGNISGTVSHKTFYVAGSWNNTAATFTAGQEPSVIFNGTASGKTISTNGQSFYNATIAAVAGGTESSLQGYWKMDENTSNTTVADSANTNTATAPQNTSVMHSVGRFSGGLTLSGSNKITAPSSAPLNISGTMSISVWINPVALPALNSLASIVSKYDANPNNGGYDLRLYNNAGTQNIGLATATGPWTSGGGDVPYTLSTGSWNMVTATFDGSYYRFYVNGNYVNQIASANGPGANTKALNIGGFGYYTPTGTDLGRYFNGSVDELRIYSGRVLTQSEISNLYAYNSPNSPGSYTLSSNLTALNNFTVSSGTLDANGKTIHIGDGGTFANSGGTFTANGSTVAFDGSATISGNTTFNNVTATTADKTLSFAGGSTQTISGTWTVTGTKDHNVVLQKKVGDAGVWNVNPSNVANVNIRYATISESVNQNASNITAYNSNNVSGNTKWTFTTQNTITASASAGGTISPNGATYVNANANQAFSFSPSSGYYIASLVVDGVAQPTLASPYTFSNVITDHTIVVNFIVDSTRIWTGGGSDSNWNTDANWSGNAKPIATNDVIFDGTSTKASTIDSNFAGTVNSLSINSGYTNTVSASRDLTITGDINLAAGTFAPGNQTINVGGSWNNTGGIFTKGASTVNFNGSTAGKTINTGGTGTGKDFYNMTVNGAAGGAESGLAGYWKFDGNGNDSSGNGKAATLYGSAGFVTAKYGNGLNLNGNLGNFAATASSVLGSGSSAAYSFSVWAYARNDRGTVISDRSGSSWVYKYLLQTTPTASSVNACTDNSCQTGANTNSTYANTGWHHITGTFDNTNNIIKLYVDGSFTNQSTAPFDGSNSGQVYFGKFSGPVDGNPFDGIIDEARVYDHVLSQAEVSNLYTANSSNPLGSYALSSAISATNNLTVSSGTLDASGYNVTAGNVIQSGGTFTAPTSGKTFTVNGGWNHSSGTFTPGTGTVTFAGDAAIQGDTTFNNFTAQTGGKTLTFADSSTQTITGTMKLTGTSGSLVTLRSSTTGTQWKVNPATADVSYVDVKDSNNTNATAITANYSNDSLNNTNWTIPCFKTWTGVGSDSNWST